MSPDHPAVVMKGFTAAELVCWIPWEAGLHWSMSWFAALEAQCTQVHMIGLELQEEGEGYNIIVPPECYSSA